MKKISISMELEVEPCPFCGTEGDIEIAEYPHEHGQSWTVSCGYCGASGPGDETVLEAVKEWNKRKSTHDAKNDANRVLRERRT